MAAINTRELRAWALKGAEQRLVEIAAEAAAIHRAFPELREQSELSTPAGPGATQKSAGSEARTRKRRTGRTMTAAERQAVSERMQRYWAGRREASASTQAAPAAAQATPGESSRGGRRNGRRKSATSRRRTATTRTTDVAKRKGGTKAR